MQVQEDCPGKLEAWYRHISKGAWPFSSRDHGWPIADCSAEGLKVCSTCDPKRGVLSANTYLVLSIST